MEKCNSPKQGRNKKKLREGLACYCFFSLLPWDFHDINYLIQESARDFFLKINFKFLLLLLFFSHSCHRIFMTLII